MAIAVKGERHLQSLCDESKAILRKAIEQAREEKQVKPNTMSDIESTAIEFADVGELIKILNNWIESLDKWPELATPLIEFASYLEEVQKIVQEAFNED